MTRRKWKRGARIYTFNSHFEVQAMIFGAPESRQLWAWVIWTGTGKRCGVEGSFRGALTAANAILDELMQPEVTT